MSRLKPQGVSRKASVRPVVMMMITATIFATGPWTDSRTFWRGSSHGMPEPAALAFATNKMVEAARHAPVRAIRVGMQDLMGVLLNAVGHRAARGGANSRRRNLG